MTESKQLLSPLGRFKRQYCNDCTDVEQTSGLCVLCLLARLIEVVDDLPMAVATELSEYKID